MTDLQTNGNSKKLSTLAMLVDCLMRHEGIVSTKDLAEKTGRHERQIWKAKAELKTAKYGSATDDTLPNMAVPNMAEQVPNMAVNTCQIGQSSRVYARAPKEYPSGIGISKIGSNPPLSPLSDFDRAIFENGKITLRDDLKREWLEEFKTEDELELALKQAAAFIQPGTRKPMEALVSAQLARMARIKRETDRRYQQARESKPAGKTTAQFMDEIRAAARELELENGESLQ